MSKFPEEGNRRHNWQHALALMRYREEVGRILASQIDII